MSAENLKRWEEIFQTIYGYVESSKTKKFECETLDFSDNKTDFSEKEISTAKENENTLQLEIQLETED